MWCSENLSFMCDSDLYIYIFFLPVMLLSCLQDANADRSQIMPAH